MAVPIERAAVTLFAQLAGRLGHARQQQDWNARATQHPHLVPMSVDEIGTATDLADTFREELPHSPLVSHVDRALQIAWSVATEGPAAIDGWARDVDPMATRLAATHRLRGETPTTTRTNAAA